MKCPHCSLEVVREHGDPWQCIDALKKRLAYFESGTAAVISQLEREMTGPNDEGDIKNKVQDDGERKYWQDVIAQMKARFLT